MMDTHNFMTCDSRTTTSAPLQRSLMAPQYMMAPAYSSAPIATLSAPQYQSTGSYAFNPYHSPPPSTSMMPSLKQEYMERPTTRMLYQASSPSARSDSQLSTARSIGSNSASSKVITVNETINPADQIDFKTNVDQLMKIIQQKENTSSDAHHTMITPVHTPKYEQSMASPCSSGLASPARSDGRAKDKKWRCDGPNCGKAFVQKTHLDVHRRTHTGERPYKCGWLGCGLTFSQGGNLTTHMRRHSQEKPYGCSRCPKTFAQQGNLRSHEKTHEKLKPFTCRLGDCGKEFSQLGNMKTHQNTFHKEILETLIAKFAGYTATGDVPASDLDMFEYLKEHYKNSNKGIKGRGKGRLVAPKTTVGPRQGPRPAYSRSSSQEPVMSRVSSYTYTMGNNPSNMVGSVPRTLNAGGYGVYQPETAQHGPPAVNMLYEDDHSRHMGFPERLY